MGLTYRLSRPDGDPSGTDFFDKIVNPGNYADLRDSLESGSFCSVRIPDGTYTITDDEATPINVHANVRLISGETPTKTIIDADNLSSVESILSVHENCIVENMTLQNLNTSNANDTYGLKGAIAGGDNWTHQQQTKAYNMFVYNIQNGGAGVGFGYWDCGGSNLYAGELDDASKTCDVGFEECDGMDSIHAYETTVAAVSACRQITNARAKRTGSRSGSGFSNVFNSSGLFAHGFTEGFRSNSEPLTSCYAEDCECGYDGVDNGAGLTAVLCAVGLQNCNNCSGVVADNCTTGLASSSFIKGEIKNCTTGLSSTSFINGCNIHDNTTAFSGCSSIGLDNKLEANTTTYSGTNTFTYDTRFIDGALVKWASASTITVGTASEISSMRDSTNVKTLNLDGQTTLDITATGPGGRQTGTSETASTWYGVYLIGDTTEVNDDDVLLIPEGTSFSESGYDVARLLGWVVNDSGSDLLRRNYTGKGKARMATYDESRTTTRGLDNGGATTPTDVDFSAFVPPNCEAALMLGSMDANSAGGNDAKGTVRVNGSTHYTLFIYAWSCGTSHTGNNRSQQRVQLDGSRVIEYEVDNASNEFDLAIVATEENF